MKNRCILSALFRRHREPRDDRGVIGILLTLSMLLMLSSCFHSPAPFLPKDAVIREMGLNASERPEEQPCLQVLILYGNKICAHAALRLQHPMKKTLFWDPAGGYGHDGSVEAERASDIIIDNPPSLNDYLFFRTEITTAAAEIFEWWISAEEADQLYRILASGVGKSNPKGRFSTQGTGFFCSSHVSDFLERFAANIITVKKEFYPHNLALQLYQQFPDRVLYVTFRDGVFIRLVE